MGKLTDDNLKRKLYEKQLGIRRNVHYFSTGGVEPECYADAGIWNRSNA
ncbi:MAG: hypothetical protein J0H77_12705 [Alphaproteobacteria bacterium]|jgi:hypothetical protein|nr:hypothetical protein [Alphaproteobacteria bacterium]